MTPAANTPATPPGAPAGGDDRVARLERELAEVREALRQERELFSAGPIVAVRCGAEDGWPIRYASSNADVVLGWTADELVAGGVRFADLVHPDDRDWLAKDIASLLGARNEEFRQEYRVVRRDGSTAWVRDHTMVLYDGDGGASDFLCYLQDITHERDSVRALRDSRESLRTILHAMPQGVFLKDAEGRWLVANDAALGLFGLAAEEALGRADRELAQQHPAFAAAFEACAASDARAWAGGKPLLVEEAISGLPGGTRTFSVHKTPLFDPDGSRRGLLVVTEDITEQVAAQKQLEAKDATFEALTRHLPGLLYTYRVAADGTESFPYASSQAGEVWGVAAEEAMVDAAAVWDLVHPDDRRTLADAVQRSATELSVFDHEHRYRHPTKGERWLRAASSPTREADGAIVWHGYVEDSTERHAAEIALRRTRDMLENSSRLARVGGWEVDFEHGEVTWSEMTREIHEVPPDYKPELETAIEFYKEGPDRDEIRELVRRAVEEGIPYETDKRIMTAKGRERWVRAICIPERVDGRCRRIYGAFQDIDSEVTAREAIRASEERFRRLFEDSPIPLVLVDAEGVLRHRNRHFEALFGYPAEELRRLDDWWPLAYPQPEYRAEVRARWEALVEKARAGDGIVEPGEYRVAAKDGTTRHVVISGLAFGDEFMATFVDVTAIRKAEEEHAKLEARLHRAQTLESIGRLAGGIAHDFNNMLVVILNSAEAALQVLPPESPADRDIREVIRAAERSAALTRQLLAFARKQPAAPKVVDLNAVVSSTLGMLTRLIGEGIQLSWRPGQGLPAVRVDPQQVDQVLANLVVNARDALGGRGSVWIETGIEQKTGNDGGSPTETWDPEEPIGAAQVRLVVADDGPGMDAETMANIFDPFFTTKPVGEGTGLGLATVYGIVRQNGGRIRVKSAPGRGTQFTILLPAIMVPPPPPTPMPESRIHRAEGETILVVEDEPDVLAVDVRLLQRLGYEVLAADGPEKALELAAGYPGRIHAVLADVVMPGMNGREMAERLLARRPEARILFTSGYTQDVIAVQGFAPEDGAAPATAFLQKPFTVETLSAKLRELLDAGG